MFAFFLPKDMVMGLMLPFSAFPENWLKLGAKELRRVPLIRSMVESHPDQVQVVGHEAISGAEKGFPSGTTDSINSRNVE